MTDIDTNEIVEFETVEMVDLMGPTVVETDADVEANEEVETEITTWEEFLLAAIDTMEGLIKAYAISKIANAVIEFMGVERELPPQMFYNYSRKGMIAKRDKNEKGLNTNHLYTADEVHDFLKKYIAKNIAK